MAWDCEWLNLLQKKKNSRKSLPDDCLNFEIWKEMLDFRGLIGSQKWRNKNKWKKSFLCGGRERKMERNTRDLRHPASSLPSPQSLLPSQRWAMEIHELSLQRNSPAWHGSTASSPTTQNNHKTKWESITAQVPPPVSRCPRLSQWRPHT